MNTKSIIRLMHIFNESNGGPPCDTLWWYSEGDTLRFAITCSDYFCWGCADAEDIYEDDIPLLEECFRDAKAVGDGYDAGELYCCRKRQMRPQGACYEYLNPKIQPLIDACGPYRESGIGNPLTQEQGEAKRTERQARRAEVSK